MAMRWSPSTSSPRWSTASTRSASPSKARPRSAPRVDHVGLQVAGWVEPQPSLMFDAVGLGVRARRPRRPGRRSTSGATAEAAPLAQSTTDPQPVEAPAVQRRPTTALEP